MAWLSLGLPQFEQETSCLGLVALCDRRRLVRDLECRCFGTGIKKH